MELLVNDLSFHGQFHGVQDFRAAIATVMQIRETARRFGRALQCHRNVINSQITPESTLAAMINGLEVDERRALLQWISRLGPFWDEVQWHSADDWLECEGDIITDTALAEAAWCSLEGLPHALVSVRPSTWERTPLAVTHVRDHEPERWVNVANYWDPKAFESFVCELPLPLATWDDVEEAARAQCVNLFIAANAFQSLRGAPFTSSAAHRLLVLLNVLNRLRSCIDENGRRTAEGNELYQNYFTGKKGNGGRGAVFSDSSDQEKREFEDRLTFPHPEREGEYLFCPMHGKVQTPQLRIHFSELDPQRPLYVVYVGVKLTKR